MPRPRRDTATLRGVQELDLLDTAVDAFDRRLELVGLDQWTHVTPCRGWTVYDLVEHVIAGNNLAISLLAGDRPTAPGADPSDVVAEFRRSVHRQTDAFAGAAPTVELAHPAGRITGREFVVYRAGDIAVHAWDLARTLATDESLGAELVKHALAPYASWVTTLDAGEKFGDGPSGHLPPGVLLQDRLLDQLGRRP